MSTECFYLWKHFFVHVATIRCNWPERPIIFLFSNIFYFEVKVIRALYASTVSFISELFFGECFSQFLSLQRISTWKHLLRFFSIDSVCWWIGWGSFLSWFCGKKRNTVIKTSQRHRRLLENSNDLSRIGISSSPESKIGMTFSFTEDIYTLINPFHPLTLRLPPFLPFRIGLQKKKKELTVLYHVIKNNSIP